MQNDATKEKIERHFFGKEGIRKRAVEEGSLVKIEKSTSYLYDSVGACEKEVDRCLRSSVKIFFRDESQRLS